MNIGANLSLSGLGCSDCVVPTFLGTNNIEYPIDSASVKTTVPYLLRENTPQRYADLLNEATGNINIPTPANISLTPLPSIVNLPGAIASAAAAAGLSTNTWMIIGAVGVGLWLFGKGR